MLKSREWEKVARKEATAKAAGILRLLSQRERRAAPPAKAGGSHRKDKDVARARSNAP